MSDRSPPAPVEASVVIPAHNAGGVLGRQLDALTRQHGAPSFEVIVVANRCADDTADVARRFAPSLDLTVVVADDVASAAYARNRGAAAARAPFVLFCDADDEVGPTWVAGMVDPLRAGRADLVGGVIHVDRRGLPDWIYTWRHRHVDGRAVVESPGRLPYALSASLGVTAEAFAAVGGFDEQFAGAGAEERDLQHRLLRAGYRTAAASDAHLTYTPRHGVHANLAQLRSYYRGELLLRAKEGQLERQTLTAGLRQALRVTGYELIRRHTVHPVQLYTIARWRVDRAILHSRARPGDALASGFENDPACDFAAPLDTPVIGGLAFTATRASEGKWYAEAGIEREALALLAQLLPSGGTFVDVGANIGIFSTAAARLVGPEGRVIAFEPADQTRAVLTCNLSRHRIDPLVIVHPAAVGATRGRLEFRRYENSLVSGLGTAPAEYQPGPLIEQTMVEVVTLDDVVDGPVDVVKIDVEGFETDVIAGARRLLASSPNVSVIFEINPTSLAAVGRNVDALIDLFPADEWDLRLLGDDALSGADLVAFISQQPAGWYSSIVATRADPRPSSTNSRDRKE